MVQRAKIDLKSAPLASDFAKGFVARRFGDAAQALIYEALPRYSRGKHKGEIKGWVHWYKVTEGGWANGVGNMSAGVYRPGTRHVRISLSIDPFAADNGKGALEDRSWFSSGASEAEWLDHVRRALPAIIRPNVSPATFDAWYAEALAKGWALRPDDASAGVKLERAVRVVDTAADFGLNTGPTFIELLDRQVAEIDGMVEAGQITAEAAASAKAHLARIRALHAPAPAPQAELTTSKPDSM